MNTTKQEKIMKEGWNDISGDGYAVEGYGDFIEGWDD